MPDELQGRKIKGQDWAGGDEAGQASKGQPGGPWDLDKELDFVPVAMGSQRPVLSRGVPRSDIL